MKDEDIARVNAAGAVDFVVESATADQVVMIGFVDEPRNIRVRIVFDGPIYMQSPWRFSARTAQRRTVAELLEAAPSLPRWQLPDRQTAPKELPSLSFDELRDARQEGATLLAFVSEGATPAEPPCFILAQKIAVVTSADTS